MKCVTVVPIHTLNVGLFFVFMFCTLRMATGFCHSEKSLLTDFTVFWIFECLHFLPLPMC